MHNIIMLFYAGINRSRLHVDYPIIMAYVGPS